MLAQHETNHKMKASVIAGTSLLLLLAGAAYAADPVNVTQNGSYQYTYVRQNEHTTNVVERRISEHRYGKLSVRLPVRIERLTERYEAHEAHRLAKGRPICSGGGGANTADLQQSGSQNQANIVQEGSGNTAAAAQTGIGNLAYTAQMGSGFDAITVQTGDGNIVFIVQRCR